MLQFRCRGDQPVWSHVRWYEEEKKIKGVGERSFLKLLSTDMPAKMRNVVVVPTSVRSSSVRGSWVSLFSRLSFDWFVSCSIDGHGCFTLLPHDRLALHLVLREASSGCYQSRFGVRFDLTCFYLLELTVNRKGTIVMRNAQWIFTPEKLNFFLVVLLDKFCPWTGHDTLRATCLRTSSVNHRSISSKVPRTSSVNLSTIS